MRAFEKGYSLLFGRSAKKLALYATLLLSVFIIYKTLAYPTAPFLYILFGGAIFLLLSAIDSEVINSRRSYYVSVISTLVVAFFDLVLQKPPLTFALIGALVSALVIQSLRCKSIVFVLPIVLTAAIYYMMKQIDLALLSLSYAVVMYSLKPVVNKMTGGIDAVCMFSSFIYAVFAEDDIIEDAFRELGRIERVPVHVYLVGRRHVVVVSDFHPGPFRHIGGGALVDVLTQEVEKAGYKFTFLHGVGSHERDPVTKESVKKIVVAIKAALESMKDGSNPIGIRPMEIALGDVKLAAFSLGAMPFLAIVGRLKSASDDIPLWVARQVDTGHFILVDAQNKFDGVVQWRNEDVKALSDGLRKIQESPLCNSFSIGIGKTSAKHLDPFGYEIGPGGITAIVNECDGEKALLVVFDGNNLNSDLYTEIVNTYRKRGYRVVEVVTTDTHRATGVGLGRGYRIVGEYVNHRSIIETVDVAVAEAERFLAAHSVSYRRVEVEAEVLGEEGFRKIQSAVRIYKRVGGLILSAIFLVPVALVVLFT
ncbi:conserved hypothetical protein [Pyrobaculum islandicum DSM 4184]|uniref:DUF2070 domain-containing protein n=1 Tax=Pyrobaculum islandicum (strain DSM 4184 / JCM 9189 / GEO3) TaxID=384616 RepID=A1RSG2_PYRIL|nr:DUF2070 family protein [Pyrobaculum islandicum]ABL87894.1 conserved hypothetical protein [Pyrobaculum islandicum DSM 4184]